VSTPFSRTGIVAPAGVPNPTVTTVTPASAACFAASITACLSSNPSPSLISTIARSASDFDAVSSRIDIVIALPRELPA